MELVLQSSGDLLQILSIPNSSEYLFIKEPLQTTHYSRCFSKYKNELTDGPCLLGSLQSIKVNKIPLITIDYEAEWDLLHHVSTRNICSGSF